MKRNLLRTVVILMAALPVTAQPAPEDLVETIDVRVVNVEAVVTDRKGERVRGLKAEDFQLLVDGKEVPVEFFTEIAEGSVASAAPSGSEPPAPAGEAVGRSVLVFVDDCFSVAPQRDQVLRSVEKSLARLAPQDRVAVVAFDGRKLALLSGWTTDRQLLADVFAKARERRAFGHYFRAHNKDIAAEVAAAARVQGYSPTLPSTLNTSVGLGRGVSMGDSGIGALDMAGGSGSPGFYRPLSRIATATAAAMRALPVQEGRKIMLVLSGGWPHFQRQSFGPLLGTAPSWIVSGTLEGIYRPVVDTANLLGYTLYPVDVPGLKAHAVDAEATELTHSDGLISSEWERSEHYTLEVLARETGGRSSLNSNRMAALERMVTDTSSYYWLGFTPAWRADDRHHEIELQVRRPGVRVRSRSGFSDLSRETEMAMSAEGLLMFGSGAPGNEGQRVRIELGEPRRASRSVVELPVTLLIPAEDLTALPMDDGYALEATLTLAALDHWGARKNLPMTPLRVRVARQPRPGDVIRYNTTVRLRRGEQNLVFSVRDNLSGETLQANLDYMP